MCQCPLGIVFYFYLPLPEGMDGSVSPRVNAPWALFFISTYYPPHTILLLPLRVCVNAPWALFFISTWKAEGDVSLTVANMCQCPLGIVFYFYLLSKRGKPFPQGYVSMPLGHCFLFLRAVESWGVWMVTPVCQCPLGIVFYFYAAGWIVGSKIVNGVSMPLGHCFLFLLIDAGCGQSQHHTVSMPLGHCFLFLPYGTLSCSTTKRRPCVNAPWALFFISTNFSTCSWVGTAYKSVNAPWALFFISTNISSSR